MTCKLQIRGILKKDKKVSNLLDLQAKMEEQFLCHNNS